MGSEYTIEQLEKTFRYHAEDFEKNYNEMVTENLKNGDPVSIEYPFNISFALHMICKEINSLKNSVEILKDEMS